MDTQIKTTVYAAKLRKRLAELKTKREKDLAAYKTGVVAWRKAMTKWLTTNAKARVDAVTVTQLKEDRRYNRGAPFDTGLFFAGCPQPMAYPDDKQIREITSLLRHLGITGQETVRISTSDVEKYLGGGEVDE